jgi:hypothetical protein
MKRSLLTAGMVASIALIGMVRDATAAVGDSINFDMVRSAGAASCLSHNARGRVTISDLGTVQNMHVEVVDLPPSTQFTVFLLQVPNKPFGLVWYQGDVLTNKHGRGVGDFAGIFSIETFINGPGVAPAPAIFPDNATSNPETAPIQVYHMGMWFADPQDAVKAGCPATVTPFDGDHEAGIQVLNTSNFPDGKGPLLQLQ